MKRIHPSVIRDGDLYRLACNQCGKSISTLFLPVPTQTIPDKGMMIRGWLQCPECIELNKLDRKK